MGRLFERSTTINRMTTCINIHRRRVNCSSVYGLEEIQTRLPGLLRGQVDIRISQRLHTPCTFRASALRITILEQHTTGPIPLAGVRVSIYFESIRRHRGPQVLAQPPPPPPLARASNSKRSNPLRLPRRLGRLAEQPQCATVGTLSRRATHARAYKPSTAYPIPTFGLGTQGLTRIATFS